MLGTLPVDFRTCFFWSPARRNFAPRFFYTSTTTVIIETALNRPHGQCLINNPSPSHKQRSIKPRTPRSPSNIREPPRIQSACAARAISVRAPATTFSDFREA
jgi:hypothetical protein